MTNCIQLQLQKKPIDRRSSARGLGRSPQRPYAQAGQRTLRPARNCCHRPNEKRSTTTPSDSTSCKVRPRRNFTAPCVHLRPVRVTLGRTKGFRICRLEVDTDSVFAVHRNRGCFESTPKSTRVSIRRHDVLSFSLKRGISTMPEVDSNEAPKYLDVL